ncbi:MAG: S41 family peptidase [candidate division Zixibacteria bacterium]
MKTKIKIGSAAVAIFMVIALFAISFAQHSTDSIYSLVKLSSDIAFKINARYVDELDIKDLIYSGIRGMIDTLDPFSEFLEKKDFDHLMEATSGKYSGLGMTIFLKDDWVTIVSPMEGMPAYRMGLRAGDRVTAIDGESAKGMSTQEASKLMRGEAGTEVTLSISREGVDESLEYTIERAVITIKMVPYAGIISEGDSKIGYVRLARFGEEADNELNAAIQKVTAEHIDGLIFDLRSNGGGLLNQAVKVSNNFLPRGTEVVYTQGRVSDQNRKHFATKDPVIPDIPIVVLVNEMSASASEIVAGAIQDSDRGVIIGNTTFGKGLVQQIYQLTEGSALKLTTAKWYVPSGRCIQKDSRSTRHPEDFAQDTDSTTIDSSALEMFYTKGGRIVYGGGGISPDITVERQELSPLSMNLERLSMFFDFSIRYTIEHPDLPADFEVSDEMIAEFKDFMDEKEFTYKGQLEKAFDKFKSEIDTVGRTDDFSDELARIEQLLQSDKDDEFDRSIDYVKRGIKRDILTRLHGESAVYDQIVLKTDPYVIEAVGILVSPGEYASILSE